jgi:hypothetical protein
MSSRFATASRSSIQSGGSPSPRSGSFQANSSRRDTLKTGFHWAAQGMCVLHAWRQVGRSIGLFWRLPPGQIHGYLYGNDRPGRVTSRPMGPHGTGSQYDRRTRRERTRFAPEERLTMRWQHRHEEDLIRIDERACGPENSSADLVFDGRCRERDIST